VGADAARAVAGALLEMVSARPGDVVLEIGAGAGDIGQHFASAVGYVGMDSSPAMLGVFRSKLSDARLVLGDAERDWPVRDGTVTAVLASRVAHPTFTRCRLLLMGHGVVPCHALLWP
jgi:ubiquinone/menaquinone biosynthesis C-methylase UbiE